MTNTTLADDVSAEQHQNGPIVDTALGRLRGVVRDDAFLFAGVPYAQPPLGELRFRPPVPVTPWTDELDATQFGPMCPQNSSMLDLIFGTENPAQDEDCLTLNVFAPPWEHGATPTADRPVMVWIHGGGFELGASSQSVYTGKAFTRDGAVLVSINYRLGTFGFMELGQLDADFAGSGNNGLRDQICAIDWVRANIAAFGGDPDNITLFGESAGAMSLALLMASGELAGRVRRVVCQSGAASAASTPEVAQMSTDSILDTLGVATVADLQAADAADLVRAHGKLGLARIGDPEATLGTTQEIVAFLPFRPIADGDFLPVDPLVAIADGSAAGIDLMIGTNADEWTLFSMLDTSGGEPEVIRARLTQLGADPYVVVPVYEAEHPGASGKDLMTAIMTDVVFRVPAYEMADAHSSHGRVWMYRFEWAGTAMGGMMGATHGIEIPFVFDNLALPNLAALLGKDSPEDVAEVVHRCWTAFGRDGQPGSVGGAEWMPYTAEEPECMGFNTDSGPRGDPLALTRAVWAQGHEHGAQVVVAEAAQLH